MAVRPRSGGGLLCGGLAGQAGREVDVNWYCLDCMVSGPLNRQGRCATCGSNAVTESEGRGYEKTASKGKENTTVITGRVLGMRNQWPRLISSRRAK